MKVKGIIIWLDNGADFKVYASPDELNVFTGKIGMNTLHTFHTEYGKKYWDSELCQLNINCAKVTAYRVVSNFETKE